MKGRYPSCWVAILCLLPSLVRGLLDGSEDANELSLLIAVPLTKNNASVPDPGWIHLASSLLAIDHFNTRNNTLVPELAELGGCDITFGNFTVLDTGTDDKHIAMEDLSSLPDAIAGPYNEIPAFELSVMATSLKIPIVASRAIGDFMPEKHPYFSQVSADPFSEMEFVGKYLNHTRRDDYIAIVYSSTPSVMQKAETLRANLDRGRIDRQVRLFSYHSMDSPMAVDGLHDVSIRYALSKVKESGFRTIVLLPEDIQDDAPEIQEAASDFGLNAGGHFWVISGGAAQLSFSETHEILRWGKSTYGQQSFLKGAAYLMPSDSADLGERNPLATALAHQNLSFVERLSSITPITNYYDWSYATSLGHPLEAIMEALDIWGRGSSYMYDATMAIGIGACEALFSAEEGEVMTGDLLLEGIRSVTYTGTSGQISFQENSGARAGNTIPYTVVNLLPDLDEGEELMRVTEIRDPSTGEFQNLSAFPFVYADGSNDPPLLLRDVPEQNYLDTTIRAIGLSLMAVALLVVLMSTIWIVAHREHTVVMASQPWFLYTVCFGSAMISMNIFFISGDESLGWSEEMLDGSCIAAVWVNSLGMLLVYGALFMKHWRVNRLMLHKSRNITMGMMLAPVAVLVSAVIVVQSVWTASGAYGWERIEVDDVTGESIGQCTGKVAPCLFLTGFFLFIPVALAGVMAYKTLGVDDVYSDSKWVLVFILVQFQVYLVGAPVLEILRDTSPDGRFIGESLLIWTVPVSTMGLIVFPKIWLVYRMQRDAGAGSSRTDDAASRRSLESGDGPVASSDDGLSAASPTDPTVRGPRIQIVTFDY